ncbi:MAG TPA: hypothetical protein PK318_12670, partial [Accumulibacter sp.]|nr:hypothetical protein [Accumulibacter sp.]
MKRFNIFYSLFIFTIRQQTCRLTSARRALRVALAGKQPLRTGGVSSNSGEITQATRPLLPDGGYSAAPADQSTGPDRRRVLAHAAADGYCNKPLSC